MGLGAVYHAAKKRQATETPVTASSLPILTGRRSADGSVLTRLIPYIILFTTSGEIVREEASSEASKIIRARVWVVMEYFENVHDSASTRFRVM